MYLLWTLVMSLSVSAGLSSDHNFPPGFKFGAATSAYQIEGAWNASDKSESVWDRFAHRHSDKISNRDNGDIACDSYHLWERDIEIASEMGLDFYRFSISWTRLLPSGFVNHISEDGKNYYSNLIDGLLEKGIEPMVTLYHWDLPQRLQDLGGWANPLIADWFSEYAKVAFTLFGARVKTWITINEPMIMCDLNYSMDIMPPEFIDVEVAVYLCNKNVLMAHAKAWRLYDEEFRHLYHGRVSLANHIIWYEGSTEEDKDLGELTMEYSNGRYSHPIYSEAGGWPPSIEKLIEEKSKTEGYPRSRLPAFTKEEIALVKGTYDFYGINHYISRTVRRPRPGDTIGLFPILGCEELGLILESRENWKPTSVAWLRQNPEGFRHALVWLRNKYGNLTFIVTENGHSSHSGQEDHDRIEYYRDYLKQVLLAIKEDGVNVTAYSTWALMDNFEWSYGYQSHYGLYEVDFTSPQRQRTPRLSARYYAELIRRQSLDIPSYEKKL